MRILRKEPECFRLVSQQIASADSVCSNIEEGYGRLSRKEYVRFLDIARGSARETQGRYRRMKHWLSDEVMEHRASLAGEIIAILTTTIENLRKSAPVIREDAAEYSTDKCEPSSSLDPCLLTLVPRPLSL